MAKAPAKTQRRSRRAKAQPVQQRVLFGRWLSDLRPLAFLRGAFATAVFVALAIAAYRLLDVPVTQVTMEGVFRRVSYGQIEAVLRDELPAGFLSADLGALRERIETVDWVDVARVRRLWPEGILVTVTEHVAVARWGEDGLLNARGEVFIDDSWHVPAELPRLSGPPGSEGEVSQHHLDYSRQLGALGLHVSALSVDARGAWTVRVSGTGGTPVEVRLGNSDPDTRLRRFVESASGLVRRRGEQIEYVDMRYGNGFAVGWHASNVAESDGGQRGNHGTES
ncbi:MAG: cell division protein FtsQ/DivIB [Pseudomonadota bacterium]